MSNNKMMSTSRACVKENSGLLNIIGYVMRGA